MKHVSAIIHTKKGLTWTLFEQIKRLRSSIQNRPATDIENSIMGCLASATTVCIMIPMDTVKTRLVTQLNYPDLVPYNGIKDCFQRVMKEEGIGAFYRGLTPRLLSVVPMIGIQFGVYEVRGTGR
jgi:solute carrier family 25 S-adenosylmethionine transporter 26